MKEQIEFCCPHCKNKFNIDIYPVINLQTDTDLYEGLFSLELFKIECSSCKKVTMVEYDILVVDMYKKYILYLYKSGDLSVFNANKENFINSLKNNETFIKIFNELKYTRIVLSLAELLEKLLIFDYDLNDRIIEKLKEQLYIEKLLDFEKYPDINFEKIEKENLIFTSYNKNCVEQNPLQLTINFNYYNQLIDTFGNIMDKNLFEKI